MEIISGNANESTKLRAKCAIIVHSSDRKIRNIRRTLFICNTVATFHLTLATLLKSFYPCFLSNIKQGQIRRAFRAPRGTFLTLYRYYVYITSGATVDTRHRSRRTVFAKKFAAFINASTLDLTGGRACRSAYNTIT